MIERFSEDIDILLLVTREDSKDFGKGSFDKILKRICARAGRDLDIPPGETEDLREDRGSVAMFATSTMPSSCRAL